MNGQTLAPVYQKQISSQLF